MPPTPIAGSFRIAADHPCLDGHFPGRPLVPGVVLLDEILAIIRPLLPPDLAATGFGHVKFLAPVPPDQPVAVTGEIAGTEARFTAATEAGPALRGTARLAPR